MHHQATHGLTYLLLSVTLLVTRTADGQESKPATSAWSVAAGSQSPVKRLIVMTIVDDLNSDSFIRFNRSVEAFELKLELVRLGSEGRDELERKRARFEALRGALVALKNEPDLVIMLLNGRDSIVNGGEQEILRQFHEFHRTNGTRLLFAADKVCWPDEGLAEKYPFPEEREAPISQKRFLNSGALIGEASALWDLLAGSGAANLLKDGGPPLMERMNYDFQRYCSHLFVDRQQRERLNMELDHRSSLFESLSAVSASSSAPFGGGELELDFAESADRVGLKNLAHNTRPLVVLGSGSNKVVSVLPPLPADAASGSMRKKLFTSTRARRAADRPGRGTAMFRWRPGKLPCFSSGASLGSLRAHNWTQTGPVKSPRLALELDSRWPLH